MADRRFVALVVTVGVFAFAHAALTWPLTATLAFFCGGAAVAFVAEFAVVRFGWLDHHVAPKLAGVPLYALAGWTGTVYVAFRLALLVADGFLAPLLAAALATTFDALTDYRGVEDGYWTYTDRLPGPRYRGVPWWNTVGWFVVSFVTAGLALPFL